jgi:arylformamidase
VIPFTPEFVERGYDNRAACPDHPQWFAEYARRSAAVLSRANVRRDLRYGRGAKETLDLFLPRDSARGTFVFLHGGYWRALDKADFAFVAAPFVERGIAVANVNYDLCPDVTVAAIVGACEQAVAWIAREGARHGADRGASSWAGIPPAAPAAMMFCMTGARWFPRARRCTPA